ncbi:hypothetical protein P171DRAFT_436296 [Karstenula rhodostoma CBS 690.94]|uniref:Cell division cycle protein 123 n=1 Tax=Karstenula rhodostoma CBS 690.94 TaxID=1392251 RepID=A0A9P4P773_9PLEO|nr:hypothetical protein P171DRAFT_436296 [Karstenula rhodostoma CBS 690.94]
MHIRTISYTIVADDHDMVKHLQGTSNPTSRSQRFNTAHHERLDILPVVPESTKFTHEQPPWTAYGYVLWQPLIVQSQGISESHVVQIPGFLYEDLMRCHAAWIATSRFPADLIEETAQTWKNTRKGKAVLPILDGKRQWFIRLDQMSPKDSPFGGKEPSTTFEDVVIKISTSMRSWNCLQNERADAEREGREMKIELVLNPWDEGMDSRREFRVFVPPPTATGAKEEVGQMKISAVSQYRWPFPFSHPFDFSLKHTADMVCSGANEVLESIKVFVDSEMSKDIRRLLVRYGFSFDVALQEDGSVQLVEANPFGALSGCGACLFNWVRDGKLLYGLDEDVEFAVTLEARDENAG